MWLAFDDYWQLQAGERKLRTTQRNEPRTKKLRLQVCAAAIHHLRGEAAEHEDRELLPESSMSVKVIYRCRSQE